MHVNDFFDVIGGILLIALVAVVLTKKNTSSDLAAAGHAFTGSLAQAEKG